MIGRRRWRVVQAGSLDKGDRINHRGEEWDIADIKVASRVDGGGPSLLTFLLVANDGKLRRWENFLADATVRRAANGRRR